MALRKKIPKDARLLGKKEVLRIIPWSHSTLYRKIKEGSFPAPVRFSTNRSGWWSHEVFAHLEQIAEAA